MNEIFNQLVLGNSDTFHGGGVFFIQRLCRRSRRYQRKAGVQLH